MVNYAVTDYSIVGDFDAVLAALETQIETIDNAKTLRHISIVPRGNEFVGCLIYDA